MNANKMCCAVLSCSLMSDCYDPMDCSLLASSFCGILQTRILEWVAIPFSRVSSQLIDPRSPHWRWILYCENHQRSHK